MVPGYDAGPRALRHPTVLYCCIPSLHLDNTCLRFWNRVPFMLGNVCGVQFKSVRAIQTIRHPSGTYAFVRCKVCDSARFKEFAKVFTSQILGVVRKRRYSPCKGNSPYRCRDCALAQMTSRVIFYNSLGVKCLGRCTNPVNRVGGSSCIEYPLLVI